MMRCDNALLRSPAPRLWIEWCEDRRIGLLVGSDDSGRCGTIEVFWEQSEGEPVLAQATLAFGFDGNVPPLPPATREFGLRANEHPLAEHLRFRFASPWVDHLQRSGAANARLAFVRIAAEVLRDAAMLFAFSPLLLHRPEIEAAPVTMAQVNRARLRHGRSPLLDHLDVSLTLDGRRRPGHMHRESCRPARLHFVRGHMVHRADKTFWRRSHLRGESLSVVSRTVHVR